MCAISKEEYERKLKGIFVNKKTCFFCDEDFFDTPKNTNGIVFWKGANGDEIALHQACAESLGVKLIQDARSLVSITKLRSGLTHSEPRDVSVLWYTKDKSPELFLKN